MVCVDFSIPANVFETRAGRAFLRQKVTFHRFETLAEAVEYVMEDMPKGPVLTTVEVEGREFGYKEIQELYQSKDYPLQRTPRG